MFPFTRRAVAAAVLPLLCSAVAAQTAPEIVTVVKVMPLPWFARMEQGVQAFDEAQHKSAQGGAVRARLVGPSEAEPQPQVKLIEGLLRDKPKALAIVPTDPSSVEDVARRAMAQGIVVVTHEADNQVHTQADLEAVDSAKFGAALNERLASCMGGQGKWTTFLGTRGSRTHVRWIEGATTNATARHTGMQLIEPLNESNDNAEQAYARARDLLKRYPDLRGFLGTASSDVIGIGRAVREAGLAGKVCVVGTGLPSRSRELLDAGVVQAIGFWDARDAGLALNRIALRVLQGQALSDGMDLDVPGYRHVSVRPGAGRGVVVTGDAAVVVDREGARAYPF